MTMSRSGLSSLMGYANGGDLFGSSTNFKDDTQDLNQIIDANAIINSSANTGDNAGGDTADIASQSSGIADLDRQIIEMLNKSGSGDSDIQTQYAQYRKMLNDIMPPRPRASGYDLASSLGKGLLSQQSEKFPSMGRGVSLGFQDFNKLQKEIDEANRKDRQSRDLTAFGMVTKKKGDASAKLGALWKDDDGNFFRELIIGDEIVYKGEGQVLSQLEFGEAFPTARPTVASEEQRYNMDINKFFEYEEKYMEEEASLNKLEDYMKAMGGSKVGFARMAESVTASFKTIFGAKDITPEALEQGMAEGKFQGLIGRFRVETVGPGVMTEFDAIRIINALGGEPGALQNKYRAAAILKDIFEGKEKLYKSAAKRYNLGAGSGEFAGYEPTEIKTWDKSMFDFPLEILKGQTLVKEITDASGKVVGIMYKENGKTYRKLINGSVEEIKGTSTIDSDDPTLNI